MFCVSYDTQMARRYDSSPTALPDLYGMYNPFAYPQIYTQTMANRMMAMVDDSVQRGLRRYFDQNEMPELELNDLGAEFRIVSNVYGYSPSEIRVEKKDGFLTISGEKRQSFTSPDRLSQDDPGAERKRICLDARRQAHDFDPKTVSSTGGGTTGAEGGMSPAAVSAQSRAAMRSR
jgi:HSP20 family molecular chaperone IbpA